MESLIDSLNKLEKDKEDFKKSFEEFISHWEKEAEDLRDRELTEDAIQRIHLNFENTKPYLGYYSDLFSESDYSKLELTEAKLNDSLAIAGSNYRSKNRTWWERLIDKSGINIHFGKGN